ncbi:hypothetical protein [Pandoraea cepalis]|uniref:hypothetical protein n=1 Tax=Pandoraea cepalis TaxID=2508294 RepID=UPI00263B8F97|nr:hypothetical protein [Pandoraea cepalis]
MCENLYSNDIDDHKSRVEHVIDIDPNGDCQTHKVSEHSPSAVDSEEIIARGIDFPLRQDPVSGINDTLFQDAFTFGASSQRLMGEWSKVGQAIHDRYEERARRRRSGEDGRPANEEWQYIGAIHVTARELRELQLEDVPRNARVRVYDAGHSADDPLHADVMVDASDFVGELKAKRKLLRVKLMNVACRRGLFRSPYLSVTDPRLLNIQIELHPPI